ncbi:MAG: O-antigen ligase family protein [Pseudohongiella sp.]
MRTTGTPGWWRPDASPDQPADAAGNARPNARPNKGSSDESNLPFYALLLFTFILFLAPQQIFPVLAPLRIAMLSIVLVSTVHVGSRLARGLPVLHCPPGVIIALGLTAWAICSIPLSLWPGGSLNFLTGKYFKTIIVFLLLASVINSAERLKGISWALVIMAVPLALTAINNLLSGVTMEGGQRIVGYDAPLAENPNDMALLLNLLLPLAIGLFLGATSVLRKMILLAMVTLMVAGVIATFSRAGFLTLAVTFVCYLFLLRRRPGRFFAPAILVIAIVALPIMPGDYIGRLSTITDVQSDETGSAQIRLRDSVTAVRLVLENPFLGTGVGTNALAMNDARGSTWTEIHNVYLTIGVELGLPGVILFLMLLIAAIKAAHAMVLQTRAQPQLYGLHCLAEGIKVSLIAFSVAAFFHPVAYHFYFYYIAGLAMALSQISLPDTLNVAEGNRL